MLCPGCGRELQAASPRLLTLALPSVLVLLLVVVLVGQFGLSQLRWGSEGKSGLLMENIAITPVRSQSVTTDENLAGITLIALEPLAPATQNTPTSSPVSESAETAAKVSTAALAATESVTDSVDAVGEGAVADSAIVNPEPSAITLALPTEAAVEPTTPMADVPTPEAMVIYTVEPTATNTPFSIVTNLPSATRTPMPTTVLPTATSQLITVQPTGDIRSASLTSTVEVMRANEMPTPNALPSLVPTSAATPTVSPISTQTPIPWSNYTVKTGDTLVSIATRFGIPTSTLMEANALSAVTAADLQIGRVLVLPGVAPVETASSQSYIVSAGDTLVGIALRFAVDTDSLLRANSLRAEDARALQVGQVLIIPTSSDTGSALLPVQTSVPVQTVETQAPAISTPAPIEYTVRAGDTIVGIAVRFGTTTQAILALNSISVTNPRTIRPGDVLLVPPTP